MSWYVDTVRGDAELVRQPGVSLGEDILIRTVAFNSNNGAGSSTLMSRLYRWVYEFQKRIHLYGDKDAGHGNDCDGEVTDNLGE